MGPDGVVVTPPGLDEDLGFSEGVEDLSVQKLVAQARVEALDVPVLPGGARLDEGRAGSDRGDPTPHGLGDELGAVVRADVGRNAAQEEQVGQDLEDIGRGELPPDPDRQALPGELVQDIEGAEGPAVVGPVMHEVVGPDLVRPLGA